MIQLHSPVTTTRVGMAFNMPINDAIERLNASARELSASAEKAPGHGESFGSQIAQAVKTKLASGTRPRIAVYASSDSDEGFAQRLKEAAKKKSGAKRHKEYAERERDRYEQQRKRAIVE
jgi:hypothetical protein